jgi:hypothetical protein
MTRTMTGFDRSFASRKYDKSSSDLRRSQMMRMSMTGFTTG